MRVELTHGLAIEFIERNDAPGKLADAELHFTEGPLAGLRLMGFSLWERRTGGGKNLTYPARQYSINGERRSFALLRPIGNAEPSGVFRDTIIAAFDRARDPQPGPAGTVSRNFPITLTPEQQEEQRRIDEATPDPRGASPLQQANRERARQTEHWGGRA